jgi:hypothetical protein
VLDAVHSYSTACLPCSAPCVSYTLGSVFIFNQPKTVEPKMRKALIKLWCKSSRGVKAKRSKTVGRKTSRPTPCTYIREPQTECTSVKPSKYNRVLNQHSATRYSRTHGDKTGVLSHVSLPWVAEFVGSALGCCPCISGSHIVTSVQRRSVPRRTTQYGDGTIRIAVRHLAALRGARLYCAANAS